VFSVPISVSLAQAKNSIAQLAVGRELILLNAFAWMATLKTKTRLAIVK
jgi:hypothetical protein